MCRVLISFVIYLVVLVPFALPAQEKSDVPGVGDMAPEIVANDQDGRLWKMADHLDRDYLVIYFYPAAMTGGCTKQAQAYRDRKTELEELNVEVVGISGDPVVNLKHFQKAHDLNFSLLSDVSGAIAASLGVPVGTGGTITREIEGQNLVLGRACSTSRWTFVVDRDRNIVYKDAEVEAAMDSQKVMDFIRKQKG
jgi:peroxiredoxin Q/BCP